MINTVNNLKCKLGEGLIWDHNLNVLLMTDIIDCKLIAIDVATNTHRQWKMLEQLAWVLLTERKGIYVLGLKSGIALFDINSNKPITWINQEFPNNPECRLNDACSDATGKIWYGSMNFCSEDKEDGQLASISNKQPLKIHDSGFTVTNGPIISPNGEFLYLNDTIKGIIYRYNFSLISGDIVNKKIFYSFQGDYGFPDGMCFDIDDNLWVAMWGGGRVIKINPDGKMLSEYLLPALNITNICFGGTDLNRIFISSASSNIDELTAKTYQKSGCVFELLDHKTKGFQSNLVKMEGKWNLFQ